MYNNNSKIKRQKSKLQLKSQKYEILKQAQNDKINWQEASLEACLCVE